MSGEQLISSKMYVSPRVRQSDSAKVLFSRVTNLGTAEDVYVVDPFTCHVVPSVLEHCAPCK